MKVLPSWVHFCTLLTKLRYWCQCMDTFQWQSSS